MRCSSKETTWSRVTVSTRFLTRARTREHGLRVQFTNALFVPRFLVVSPNSCTFHKLIILIGCVRGREISDVSTRAQKKYKWISYNTFMVVTINYVNRVLCTYIVEKIYSVKNICILFVVGWFFVKNGLRFLNQPIF